MINAGTSRLREDRDMPKIDRLPARVAGSSRRRMSGPSPIIVGWLMDIELPRVVATASWTGVNGSNLYVVGSHPTGSGDVISQHIPDISNPQIHLRPHLLRSGIVGGPPRGRSGMASSGMRSPIGAGYGAVRGFDAASSVISDSAITPIKRALLADLQQWFEDLEELREETPRH